MTINHIIAWVCIVICMPIVLSLAVGMDPMGFYKDAAALFARAGVRFCT